MSGRNQSWNSITHKHRVLGIPDRELIIIARGGYSLKTETWKQITKGIVAASSLIDRDLNLGQQ